VACSLRGGCSGYIFTYGESSLVVDGRLRGGNVSGATIDDDPRTAAGTVRQLVGTGGGGQRYGIFGGGAATAGL